MPVSWYYSSLYYELNRLSLPWLIIGKLVVDHAPAHKERLMGCIMASFVDPSMDHAMVAHGHDRRRP